MQTKTQVAIIGGGPAGLLLSHILDRSGIDNIVVERQSKAYVLGRIRAGVLEADSVQMLRDFGLGERMDREGKPKNGSGIAWQDKPDFFIDVKKWTGKQMMAYGQTAITEDLYQVRERDGGEIVNEAKNVSIHDILSDAPHITYEKDGEKRRIDCGFAAGCDGFHGVSRQSISDIVLKTYERAYPFGWLGIMVEKPPIVNLVYAYHERGFALASLRSEVLSRYYVQCAPGDTVDDWPDDRFWEELLARFPKHLAEQIVTGPSIEKSIAPLRSFVVEPMRYGRLFLAGDAAYIVPPTGAKGLNLAFSDVHYLSRALVEHHKKANNHYLDTYADTALRRVWSAENLSWRLTRLLHVFPGEDPFDERIWQNNYDLLLHLESAQETLAREYVGLPFDD
ncbi:MAG: 4-hydroxybenzoate 3-monooxygenase [Hyphomicrobiales bacterium]|nr:4-hydroxybenzoate 3-monooxygenase [Hyphomicrobiales bacterium]MCP5002002.1 4-hydroxybenzoate 3-monooxygenase [Hyphomicrobiales bacterium]